jgi:hypothetical protein
MLEPFNSGAGGGWLDVAGWLVLESRSTAPPDPWPPGGDQEASPDLVPGGGVSASPVPANPSHPHVDKTRLRAQAEATRGQTPHPGY